jgi:excisionase family DNA binding protein
MEQEKEIIERLTRIEKIVSEKKQVMNFDEFCEYAAISHSFGYKLTSSNSIPFYRPHGKLIYFEKAEVDTWLLKNRIKTVSEIKNEGNR